MEEKRNFDRIVVVAPTRSTCLNISMVLSNGAIPPTLLMREKRKEIFEVVDGLETGGFGVVAGTGTGKTVAIRDIAGRVLGKKLLVDIITREHEATDYTWTCNVLVVTPGVALHWLKSKVLTKDDLIVVDEIHQTSDHLELTLALAKRENCKFIWMSATIDPAVYSNYLDAATVIECSAFDPSRKSEVETTSLGIEYFLDSKVDSFISESRAVAVFVPTRAMAEELSKEFGTREGLYCDFYHGGEKAEKLRQFLKGDVPKPFMVFMTIAGASSLNILGLDTVVIVDQMFTEVIHSGVPVLEKVKLGANELLQMGGRVNGRAENSKIFILTNRTIDFHELKPTVPQFVLGGDLQRVALTCARLGINANDLDLIAPIDQSRYEMEVKRFKNRGIIEAGSDNLTTYGKKIERLPVEPSWAEMLVQTQDSDEKFLDVVAISSCVESLYSLLRRDAVLSEVGVSESDHLTAYNIIVFALNKFGYLRKSKNNGGGAEYGFQGDWLKKQFNHKTGKTEKSKGEFISWCDKYNFNAKAIKEAAIAMKSVYRQLGVKLPEPQELQAISRNDNLHIGFLNLLARVQSLDFVINEYNSKAGTVWAAQSSFTGGNRVLGKIRHWTDRRGCQRATIEGTEVPEDLLKLYADKKPESVYQVTDEGVEIEFKSSFAGESVGSIVEVMADFDIPAELIEQAERKFIDAFMAKRISEVDVVVDRNRKTLTESIGFWIRSGGVVRKMTDSDERKLYEQEFAGKGIVSVQSCMSAIQAGKVKPANLLLKLEDFISTEEQEKIIADNPEMIIIDNETLTVNYSQSWGDFYAKTEVSEEFTRNTKTKAVTLPSGRIVEFCCEGHSAKSFPELVEKLEQARIKQCWIDKCSELEHTSWISNPEEVFPHLPKILTAIEITRTDNGQGEPIFGYFSLYSDSDPDFQIRLTNTEEYVKEETKVGLERLLQKATREERRIPNEEQWIGDLREILRNSFDALINKHAENLTPENIQEQIKAVKTEIETVKMKIGGKHAESQQLITKTEAKISAEIEVIDDEFVKSEISQAYEALSEAKKALKNAAYEDVETACEMAIETADRLAGLTETRSVLKSEAYSAEEDDSDKIYNLKEGYEEFSEATSEEKNEAYQLSQDISSALHDRKYEEVISKIGRIREIMKLVLSATPERQAIRRARFPEKVWEAVDNDEREAELVTDFAKAVAEFVGQNRALKILQNEHNANYDYVRQQDALRHAVPELEASEIGERFFYFSWSGDVDMWLLGAIAWLEFQIGIEAPKIVGNDDFIEAGKRYFKCGCGCQTRVTKSEWKQYQIGQSVKICCSVCEVVGIVQKAEKAKEESKSENSELDSPR